MTARPPSSAARVRDEQHLSRIAHPQLPSFHYNLKTALFAPYRRANVGKVAANGSSPSQFRSVERAGHSSQIFIPGSLPTARFYKVEALSRPRRVPHVPSGLIMGIRGATVSDVRGFGARPHSAERQAERILKNLCSNDTYKAILNMMSPSQISTMKSTAFANLIDMPLLKVDLGLLEDIIEKYRGDSTFEITQGVHAVMTVEDVGRILGIPSKGMKIVPITKSIEPDDVSIFVEEFISKMKRNLDGREKESNIQMYKLLHKDNLEKILIELTMKNKEEDIVDMCRVWMLYLMSTFLLPTSTYAAPAFVIPYLHDLQSTTSMNWAKLVHTILFQNMEALQMKISKRREGQPSRALYASSFTMCLIAWNLEMTQKATPQFPEAKPSIKKWVDPIKKTMTLSDVAGSKVVKEIEYDKDDERKEMKDQEEADCLTSTNLEIPTQIQQSSKMPIELKGKAIVVASENEERSEDMMERLKFVQEELVRTKEKFNATFLEKFWSLMEENKSLKDRNMELENENKVLRQYINQDLIKVMHEYEVSHGQNPIEQS